MSTRFALVVSFSLCAFLWAQPAKVLYEEKSRVAENDVQFSVNAAGWGTYVLDAEIRFQNPGGRFRLAAGPALEATPDSADSQVALRVVTTGAEVVQETERLKPAPHKGWGAGAEQELEQLARSLPGWRDRWFPVRVEVSKEVVWFHFDGRALTSVPRGGGSAPSVEVSLPKGSALRNFRISSANQQRGGYLPVKSDGYSNQALPRAELEPGREVIAVAGVPFHWGEGRPIDVGQAGLRIRKKPSGPGSLYQNPFNSISAMDGDPLTILLRVPKRYYRRAFLLAASNPDGGSPSMTIRLARYRGDGGCYFADSVVEVPTWDAQPRKGMPESLPAHFVTSKGRRPGRLWLIEAPLDPGAFQDVLAADLLSAHGNSSETLKLDSAVRWMEIELTRRLEPDLQAMLPLGPPSGVEVYAVTLDESPLRLAVTSSTPGNIFEVSETPAFDVWLENVTGQAQPARLDVRTRNHYGEESMRRVTLRVPPGGTERQRVELPQKQFGKFDVTFEASDSAGARLARRQTTFAILPPDTRQAERDSPFGLWSWGGGHLSPSNEIEARLMRKAGARHTLGVGYPSKRQFGINTGTDIVTGIFYSNQAIPAQSADTAREMVESMKKRGTDPVYWQMYWEDMISDRHHRRFPPALIERPPLELSAAEEARFQAYWTRAVSYARLARQQLPGEKLALGAWMNFTEEFLRRRFPKELLDAITLEVGGYRAQPERQPDPDDLNGLFLIRQLKQLYGYGDLETVMVESLFHGTAPGYLSEKDQANYYVRDFLLGLANGVKLFAMSAMIADVANDYYRSSWGSVGLCNRAPEINPKESYVAYATMTSVLDRARFTGFLDTGSTGVYALHFQAKDGANIYALWTVRGERDLKLEFAAPAATALIDAMHNERPLTGSSLTVSESPVYLRTTSTLRRVQLGEPRHATKPPAGAVLLDPLRELKPWRPRNETSDLLENGNPRYPRRAGDFHFSEARDLARGPVVEVTSRPVNGPPLLPMYGVLERNEPIPIPGQPRKLGLWVDGNSGWGRISFELRDNKGERWTFAGGGEDIYGRSFINFDGWRWMEIDLCGHHRPDYPRPSHGNWTSEGGDGLVDYPLTLTKIIVELRDHVVYVNQLAPVNRPAVRLSNLHALY